MGRKIFLLLIVICGTANANVIYQLNNRVGSQDGHEMTGWIEFAIHPTGDTWSQLITPDDWVQWSVDITGPHPASFSGTGGITPLDLVATETDLSFPAMGEFAPQSFALFEGVGEPNTIIWQSNDVQKTIGYWSKFGTGRNDYRWIDVIRTDRAVVGVNPVVAPEPSVLAMLAGLVLMAFVGLRT